jgi:NAD+ kinase
MKFKTATIVANPKKEVAEKLKPEVAEFLRRKGIGIVKSGDILITIGGDGTMLYNKDKFEQPIFGIGSRKSYICQANFENWRRKLAEVLSGYKLESRMMLECGISGRKYKKALNEVVVRSRDHRVIELTVFVGNKKVTFKADGVIFATPTGSTGYAYSCGGPELNKKAKKYVVVAIAPYRRAFKPLVVDEKMKCAVYVKRGNADLVIDGQFIHPADLGDKIKIEKNGYVKLIWPE